MQARVSQFARSIANVTRSTQTARIHSSTSLKSTSLSRGFGTITPPIAPQLARTSSSTSLNGRRLFCGLSTNAPLPLQPLSKPFDYREKGVDTVLIANRGEIALRAIRTAKEEGLKTVAVYTEPDKYARFVEAADTAIALNPQLSPVAAYLDCQGLIDVAKKTNAQMVHPGYGFLSENPDFAKACENNGVTLVGPTSQQMEQLGNKTEARLIAEACGVPIIPGTAHSINSLEEAEAFTSEFGYPIMIKAEAGGGGRGMREVYNETELAESLASAQKEADSAFGDSRVFLERLIKNPRHIEVQILGDGKGNAIHLFERDCTVQRRHQKVVEEAPAIGVPQDTRTAMQDHAINIAKHVNYKNAGTVEFLLDENGSFYFIEMNTRLQVEHPVTELITGLDLIQAQYRIAAGASFPEEDLHQTLIKSKGHSLEVRVTTEKPHLGFEPDLSRIDSLSIPEGRNLRVDSGAYPGQVITADFDSMIAKVIAYGNTRDEAVTTLRRGLDEFKVTGVSTNIDYIKRILSNPYFLANQLNTSFIKTHPELLSETKKPNLDKNLQLFAEGVINGYNHVGAKKDIVPSDTPPIVPIPDMTIPAGKAHSGQTPPDGWKQVLEKEGPKGFAKAIRAHTKLKKGALFTDTTWRDGPQSLWATRQRTRDLKAIAPATAHAQTKLLSLENWGGATFDTSLRFLHECPWDRLEELRRLVPNIPFQMLLRSANGVGYKAYPDNVIQRFVETAVQKGMDIFRIFDSLNDKENLAFGIKTVIDAGGVAEGAISYTGNVADPDKGPYTLEYYCDLADFLVQEGTHILCIKDMANILTPPAATRLISAIRKRHPDLPIHVHTHDTAGVGVATQLACLEAGADIVDVCNDALSGTTSQPAQGALVASTNHTPLESGIDLDDLQHITRFWETLRPQYRTVDAGPDQLSAGSSVFKHEIPGGQYTNMLLQSKELGLGHQWAEVMTAYHDANLLLGDIPKVTPSSKVVGDLAQFMVANNLTPADIKEQAKTLSFPNSVIEYLQGYLGQPPFGFPEPLRSDLLGDKKRFEDRPGKELEPFDFDQARQDLETTFGKENVRDVDVLSYSQYPEVTKDFLHFKTTYGEVSHIPTPQFWAPLKLNKPYKFMFDGKKTDIKVVSVTEANDEGKRDVIFEINGRLRPVKVQDNAITDTLSKTVMSTGVPGDIGSVFPGQISGINVKVGDTIDAGTVLCTLSAMKMENDVKADISGTIKEVSITLNNGKATVKKGERLLIIEPSSD